VTEELEQKEQKKEVAKRAAPKRAKEERTMTKDELIAAIKNMTVLELSELVKALEAEFGVSAAAPVAVAAAPAAEAPAPEVEEKTEFTVILKEVGANKINVIKAVREVESAPTTLKEGIGKEEAATLKEKLEATGATIEVD
jgi:large subunit ribosomal protein L7/L12